MPIALKLFVFIRGKKTLSMASLGFEQVGTATLGCAVCEVQRRVSFEFERVKISETDPSHIGEVEGC